MSVANIAFLPDRILCLTDTLSYRERKPCGLTLRKCDLDPAGRYALVTRGLVFWGDKLTEFVLKAPSLDWAEQRMEAYFREVLAPRLAQEPELSVEGTLLGWSDEHQALRVVRCQINTRPMTREVLAPGWHVSPNLPRAALPATVRPDIDAARMVNIALAQQKALNHLHDFNECIGGGMHLTTVTRAGAVQELVALYPDYDQHAAEFGDPNAEEVAAFLSAQRVAA